MNYQDQNTKYYKIQIKTFMHKSLDKHSNRAVVTWNVPYYIVPKPGVNVKFTQQLILFGKNNSVPL